MAPALNLNALWYLVDDRYLYAPSIGLCLAVAVALMRIASASSSARKAVGAACAIFLGREHHLDSANRALLAR